MTYEHAPGFHDMHAMAVGLAQEELRNGSRHPRPHRRYSNTLKYDCARSGHSGMSCQRDHRDEFHVRGIRLDNIVMHSSLSRIMHNKDYDQSSAESAIG